MSDLPPVDFGSTYDSSESIVTPAESDFDGEELRALLGSPLYQQERGASAERSKVYHSGRKNLMSSSSQDPTSIGKPVAVFSSQNRLKKETAASLKGTLPNPEAWPGRWGRQGLCSTGGGGLARVPNLRVCKTPLHGGGTRKGEKGELTSCRGTAQSAWQKILQLEARRKNQAARKGKRSPRGTGMTVLTNPGMRPGDRQDW